MLKLKRILITIIAACSMNTAFADSCIMITPANITKVDCANNNIVGFHVLSTLMNEKRSLIVTSISDGETSFAVHMKNRKCDYKATVHNGKLKIKGDNTIKVLPVDLPPELNSVEDSK